MKTLLLLTFACVAAQAQFLLDPYRFAITSTNPCVVGFLEDFEDAGYENAGWTEVESGSSLMDPDYTGVVLEGSESLRFVKVSLSTAHSFTTNFCTTNEIWVYFLLRPVDIEGTTRTIASLRTNTVDWVNIQVVGTSATTGQLRLQSGVSVTTVDSISEGVTYHVWVHYKADPVGGASEGIIDVGFSTDGIRPTSGNKFAQSTVNSIDQWINRIYLGLQGSSNGDYEYIFDKLRIKKDVIGDNPP